MADNSTASKIIKYLKSDLVSQKRGKNLDEKTQLLSSGILDSLSVMKLVTFLETEFRISFEAHEIDRDYLDTVERMVSFIKKKNILSKKK